jgi:predicted PurR-regulated permease PerM
MMCWSWATSGGTVATRIAPRTILHVLLAVLVVWLTFQLWTVVIVVLIALVLVGTLDPMVAWLERRGLGRGRSLALIFFAIAIVLGAILVATVPPLVAQLQHIIEDAPKERAKLIRLLGDYQWGQSFAKAIKAVPLDDLMVRAGTGLVGYSEDILAAIGYAITTTFLAIYLLADPRHAKAMLYAVVPRSHHVKLARILLELKVIVGGYMRGQLITSLAIAVFMFVLLTILRVDDALAIAVFAALTDVIPFIGGYLASAPAVIAVANRGAPTILFVLVLMVLYQEFESRILVPRVYGRVLRLSPAIVLLALLIGGTLMGILGALLALPIAAGVQMVIRELRVELPGKAPDERALRTDAKAEDLYERLTAGAAVEDAAVVAGELAEKLRQTEHDGGSLTAQIAAMDEPEPSVEVAPDAPPEGEPKGEPTS